MELDALVKQCVRYAHLALLEDDLSQEAERIRHAQLVARLSVQRQTLLQQCACTHEISLTQHRTGQVEEDVGSRCRIAYRSEQRQALLEQVRRVAVFSLVESQAPQTYEEKGDMPAISASSKLRQGFLQQRTGSLVVASPHKGHSLHSEGERDALLLCELPRQRRDFFGQLPDSTVVTLKPGQPRGSKERLRS